jgi:CRP-like cAMP-binding protein
MTLDRTLRNHPFTRDLNDAQVAVLAAIASEVTFDENELVLVDGERSRSFFLLLRGSVSVELRTANYVVSVQALGSGQVFRMVGIAGRSRHAISGAGEGKYHRAPPGGRGFEGRM